MKIKKDHFFFSLKLLRNINEISEKDYCLSRSQEARVAA
jgi:hypothetical protein